MSPGCPRRPREAGGGVQAETTPGSSFLSWPEGAEGEEGHGEKEGVKEALLTPVRAWERTQCARFYRGQPLLRSVPSHGPGAGLGPRWCSEAALSAWELSALTKPPRDTTCSFISLLVRLGIRHRCLQGE